MNKKLIYILIFAFLIRILFFSLIPAQNHIKGGDSDRYNKIAINLLEEGVYSADEEKPLKTNFSRVPGYSTFLYLNYSLFGKDNFQAVVLIQFILSLITISTLFVLAKNLFNEKVAIFSSLFLSIDPRTILANNYILSETLFTFILIIAIFLLIRFFKKKENIFYLLGSSFLFGISVFIRPVSLYIPVFLLPIFYFYYKEVSISKFLKQGTLFLLMFIFTLSPWLIRNYMKGGTLTFTTKQADNFVYRMRGIYAEKFNQSFPSKKADKKVNEFFAAHYSRDMSRTERDNIRRNLAIKTIIQNPIIYTEVAAKGAFRLLIGPGKATAERLFGIENNKNPIQTLFGKAGMLPQFWLIWGLTFVFGVYMLGAFGIYKLYKQDKLLLITTVLMVSYFLIISSGPEAHSRFRVPIMPIFALWAGISLYSLLKGNQLLKIENK